MRLKDIRTYFGYERVICSLPAEERRIKIEPSHFSQFYFFIIIKALKYSYFRGGILCYRP
jgi:hypothetical protein